MRIWQDEHGKTSALRIAPKHGLNYEPIEHRVRKLGGEYQDIIVENKRYRACPFCFGHPMRTKE